MNKIQKTILLIGGFLIITAILFPVWSASRGEMEYKNARASLYADGKEVIKNTFQLKTISSNAKVGPDFRRMGAEVIVITILTGMGIFICKK